MNAHASPIAEAAPTDGLTTAIVQNVPLLRVLATGHKAETWTALAAELGQDRANFMRTLRRLADDGAVQNPADLHDVALTDLGRRAIRAIEVFAGKIVLPAGAAFVPARLLIPNPDNPRRDWTSEAAVKDDADLKASIAASNGPNLPPEVYPADAQGLHMLQTGERRWRATMANIADGTFAEDFEILVLIKERDDQGAFIAMGEENIQRRQLTYVEEARWFEGMIARFGFSEAEVARRANRSVKHVQDYRRLLALPAATLAELEAGEITYREARSRFQVAKPKREAEPEPELFEERTWPEPRPDSDEWPPARLPMVEIAAKILRESEGVVMRIHGRPAVFVAPRCWNESIVKGLTSSANVSGPLIGLEHLPKDRGTAVYLTDRGEYWLRQKGWWPTRDDIGLQLLGARFNGNLSEKSQERIDNGGWATEWLNEPQPEPAPEIEPAPVVMPGLVGDAFSEQLREVRNAPKDDDARKRSADMQAKDDLALGVGELLMRWRNDPARPHWIEMSRDALEIALASALRGQSVIEVAALLAVYRQRFGAMGAVPVLAAVVAYLSNVEA